MRIIRYTFPDPTDIVLQGACAFGEMVPPVLAPSWNPQNVLEGWQPFAEMPVRSVPFYASQQFEPLRPPAEVGPRAISGGAVVMQPIGPQPVPSPIVDPTQRFLASALPQDSTGAWTSSGMLAGSPPIESTPVLGGQSAFAALSEVTVPRAQILQSGLLKKFTAKKLPVNFGLKIYDNVQASDAFVLTGTTVTGAGVPLGNCRVIAYQSGWRYVETGPKIIAETVSDGSGAFTLSLRNIDYQLVAYLAGSPDLAGVTRQDVTPLVATTVYLRDPTVATPAGSASYRPVGSPVVRRLGQ